MSKIDPEASRGRAPRGSTLALLTLPFTFSQEPVLRTNGFISEAKKWGEPVSVDELAQWHELGVLVPFYRVDDEAVDGRRIDIPDTDQTILATYARGGHLRDPMEEGFSRWWPYSRPSDESRGWWDGYLFSRWQIFEINAARWAVTRREYGDSLYELRREAAERRRESMALSALATRHLPSVIGQLSMSGRIDDYLEASRFDVKEEERLAVVGYDPHKLQPAAEHLLGSARARARDPIKELWPLLRHANHRAWSKLEGEPRFAVEQRIAAEVFLRAHEELAERRALEPLPPPDAGSHFWRPIYDRIGAPTDVSDGLDRALGSMGLSPHPKVVLVVEGLTEQIHVEKLLSEIDMTRPDRVRVQVLGTSSARPGLLATYAATPRVGPTRAGVTVLDAPPTAVFIAMDPEGIWATEAKRNRERAKIQSNVRDAVEAQGGVISQAELDNLVHVFSWGDQKYELANFSNDELLKGLSQLAVEQRIPNAGTASWRADVLDSLARARRRKTDIKGVFLRAGLIEQKPRLAELLYPVLFSRFEIAARSADSVECPVIDLVLDIWSTVQRFSAGNYSFESSNKGAS